MTFTRGGEGFVLPPNRRTSEPPMKCWTVLCCIDLQESATMHTDSSLHRCIVYRPPRKCLHTDSSLHPPWDSAANLWGDHPSARHIHNNRGRLRLSRHTTLVKDVVIYLQQQRRQRPRRRPRQAPYPNRRVGTHPARQIDIGSRPPLFASEDAHVNSQEGRQGLELRRSLVNLSGY